jgi:diaminopimelate epimerase
MTKSSTLDSKPAGRFFIKMHGLLNHFVIVDARDDPWRPVEADIVRICDSKTGVGGDQLIIIEPPTDSGRAASATAFMRILNIDGREAEACGNATRCVAWLLLEETSSDEVVIETLAGLIDCRRAGDRVVSCTMGKVDMSWQKIPLSRDVDTCHVEIDGPLRDGVALNIGNPHIVFFVDDVDEVDIESIAPSIQKNQLFPNEVNVGLVQMISDNHLKSRVFERGAGLTTACGSGACVAVYAALLRGFTENRQVTVSMPAGDVTIYISEDGVATMTGPVAYCFSGYL